MPLRIKTPNPSHDSPRPDFIPAVFGHLESSRLYHDSPSCRAGVKTLQTSQTFPGSNLALGQPFSLA